MQGVTSRDIKLENTLLDGGQWPLIKVGRHTHVGGGLPVLAAVAMSTSSLYHPARQPRCTQSLVAGLLLPSSSPGSHPEEHRLSLSVPPRHARGGSLWPHQRA